MATAPEAHDVTFRRGLGWLRDHLLNHAESSFRAILKQDAEHVAARRYLGVTLSKMGRGAEGRRLLEQAVSRDSADQAAWRDLAAANLRDGEIAKARLAWGRVTNEPLPSRLAFSSEQAERKFKLIDYDYHATIRHGGAQPPHPQLDALIAQGRDRYAALVEDMAEVQADFAAVPRSGSYDEAQPFWINGWFPPLDGMVLTQMLRRHDPARFIEIGSGVSTKFARRAVDLYGLRTRLTSIDPQPRNLIDSLCDEVIRQPLEACDPALFEALEPGDILFLDSSHRCFQGSDVTVFFLEILPRVKPGVLVHIHDIYLPDDYISGHVHRLWNEQYLLATALLYGQAFEILFPGWWASQDPALRAQIDARLHQGPLKGLAAYGVSFWMTRR